MHVALAGTPSVRLQQNATFSRSQAVCQVCQGTQATGTVKSYSERGDLRPQLRTTECRGTSRERLGARARDPPQQNVTSLRLLAFASEGSEGCEPRSRLIATC